MEDEYLTPAEIAVRLRVTPQAVNGWCRKGWLRADRAGRSWRVRPADLESFLKRSQTKEESSKKADRLALTY